jgi:hypothetical protein
MVVVVVVVVQEGSSAILVDVDDVTCYLAIITMNAMPLFPSLVLKSRSSIKCGWSKGHYKLLNVKTVCSPKWSILIQYNRTGRA